MGTSLNWITSVLRTGIAVVAGNGSIDAIAAVARIRCANIIIVAWIEKRNRVRNKLQTIFGPVRCQELTVNWLVRTNSVDSIAYPGATKIGGRTIAIGLALRRRCLRRIVCGNSGLDVVDSLGIVILSITNRQSIYRQRWITAGKDLRTSAVSTGVTVTLTGLAAVSHN